MKSTLLLFLVVLLVTSIVAKQANEQNTTVVWNLTYVGANVIKIIEPVARTGAVDPQREALEKLPPLSAEGIDQLIEILQTQGSLIKVYQGISTADFKRVVDNLPRTDHVENQLCHMLCHAVDIGNIDLAKYIMNDHNTSPTCVAR